MEMPFNGFISVWKTLMLVLNCQQLLSVFSLIEYL